MFKINNKSIYNQMKIKMKTHKLSLMAVLVSFILLYPPSSKAQFGGGPQPGEVYREYVKTIQPGIKTWRVTDPNASNPGSPGNSPSDFLPNYVHSINISDYSNVKRVEVIIDAWGGHVGTTGKKMKFNNSSWITIPELNTTPTSGQCYAQQVTYVINVPVSHLKQGTNTFQGTSGGQTCYNFNWGQWGWYGIIVRVYYNGGKGQTTGSISSISNGGTFKDNPVIQVSPNGAVSKIELLAKLDAYDTDGDGIFNEWGGDYHRTSWNDPIKLNNHIGTITTSPYSMTWNTEWVPDQPNGSISLMARIQNPSGYWYCAPVVSNLTLSRTNHSVRLFKPKSGSVPQSFWVRDGQTKSSKVSINTLSNAKEARAYIRTWNGNENGESFYTRVNGYTIPKYGIDHFYSLDMLNIPISSLRTGDNTITFHSETVHHGIEIMWPGPAIIVKYGSPPAPPTTSAPVITQQPFNVTAAIGEKATFSIGATGTAPLAYQWRKNGSNISGATGSSYTTPSLSLSNDGDTYTCRVSNSAGSVISNGAKVTISSEPTPPPPPPSDGSTTKIEIENNYSKVADLGPNGAISVKNSSINSNGKAVAIPDKGDKINVSFNILSAGQYKLRVWLRSGNATYPTSYFNSNYSYQFDISGMGNVNFVGVSSSVQGPFSAWGGSHWGFMEATVNFSSTGTKTLGITADYVWQAVDYLEVIGEDGSTNPTPPPPPPPPPPSDGSTTKIEIENNYSKVADLGPNGAISVKNSSINSNGKAVAIPDKGDKINVSFNIPSAGQYKLRVWLRSGNATYPTSYFNSNYSYQFDISGMGNVNFVGVPSSVQGPFSAWGGSHWGFMEATVNFSSTGTKTLGITADYVWQAVDYLEVIGEDGSTNPPPPPPPPPPPSDGSTTKIEIENNYSKVADLGSNGAISVKNSSINSNGKAVAIFDKGDKINVSFNIPSTGQYKLRVWLRSGNATNPTSYFNSNYSYQFDISGIGNVNFVGVPSSVQGPFSAWGGSHWGFMEATVNFSSNGTKTLGITADYVWQAVDYLEIIPTASGARMASSESFIDESLIGQNGISIYPNPVSDNLSIDFISRRNNALVTMNIMDLNGRIVESRQEFFQNRGSNQMIWDRNLTNDQAVQPGIYILKLNIDDEVFS
jgi:flagellar hook assembly protein FlgD